MKERQVVDDEQSKRHWGISTHWGWWVQFTSHHEGWLVHLAHWNTNPSRITFLWMIELTSEDLWDSNSIHNSEISSEDYTTFCTSYFGEDTQKQLHIKWTRAKPIDVKKTAPFILHVSTENSPTHLRSNHTIGQKFHEGMYHFTHLSTKLETQSSTRKNTWNHGQQTPDSHPQLVIKDIIAAKLLLKWNPLAHNYGPISGKFRTRWPLKIFQVHVPDMAFLSSFCVLDIQSYILICRYIYSTWN